MDRANAIATNVARVRERIAAAAVAAGRHPEDVLLVAVTKNYPAEDVLYALRAGVRCFGENRPEEGLPKIEAVSAMLEPHERHAVAWHMIGHIQSRKAKLVVGRYELVHSLDSLRLAEKLQRLADEGDLTIKVLLEVNTSGEPSKYGFPGPQGAGEPHPQFLKALECILQLQRLRVLGLMTMAPIVPRPDMARPYFRSLRLMLEWLKDRYPEVDWQHLSMGMTGDFEAAIAEGATIVRIGRAIFAGEG